MSVLLFFLSFAPFFGAAYLGSPWQNNRGNIRALPITLVMLFLVFLGSAIGLYAIALSAGVHLTN